MTNGPVLSSRDVARRVALDIPDGTCVNLGIGLPTLVADVMPAGREIVYHSENGIVGMGPAPEPGTGDADLVNAGKQPVTLVPGGSYVHHTDSFALIRGGHVDVSVLGAFEVGERGDLANWRTNDPRVPPAVGGAMDLAVGAKRVLVVTTHQTRDGRPKLVRRCTYPLTAAGAVHRVYTDRAVLDVTPEGFLVRDLVEGLTPDELQDLTGARLRFADDLRRLAVSG